jgi:predicted alpha/beta-fold hydrolase
VFEFDDRITAPHFGFGNAPNYYKTQSSQGFLSAIAVPTLLLTAQDDPMVPFAVYGHPAIAANPKLELLAPAHGGHVAFLAREKPRFWADEAILDWRSRL